MSYILKIKYIYPIKKHGLDWNLLISECFRDAVPKAIAVFP